MKWSFGLFFFFICFTSCRPEKELAQKIVDAAIKQHGGTQLLNKHIQFEFRDKAYSVWRKDAYYGYSRSFVQDSALIQDTLINSSDFKRWIDDQIAEVPDSMQVKYANSINSVLYFFQLPYPLNDPAVFKKYQGQTKIGGELYDLVRVTFSEDGGGKDFDDEYLYWFHSSDHTLDYLAYRYQTDGGGARFRTAYNRLERDGIVFQDYINFEAPMDKPLNELGALYEQGLLKELSRIQNTNIQVSELP